MFMKVVYEKNPNNVKDIELFKNTSIHFIQINLIDKKFWAYLQVGLYENGKTC